MCGSGPQTVVYEYNMKTRKIKSKDLAIINKWTKGAMARRKFVKLVLTKTIQNLRYPCYKG